MTEDGFVARQVDKLMCRPGLAFVSINRKVLPTTHTETPASLLWFATVQCIESKQDLAGLAPKDCFIPAKPVERVAGQIGQTQKATGEVGRGIYKCRPRLGSDVRSFVMLCDAGLGSTSIESTCPNFGQIMSCELD